MKLFNKSAPLQILSKRNLNVPKTEAVLLLRGHPGAGGAGAVAWCGLAKVGGRSGQHGA